MVLGLDFLTKHHFIIDLSKKNQLGRKENTIPISLVKENNNEYQVRRVLMKAKILVPPNTIVRTKVEISGKPDDEKNFAINPNHTNPRILIPNTLVAGEKEVWIN